MQLRTHQPSDCPAMAELFYNTVHTINAQDYAPQQLAVWATGQVDLAHWNETFAAHHTIIAQQNGQIVGFGDMASTGYLDRLYVHQDYQRQGVASQIVQALEQAAAQRGVAHFTTHASITALPFFVRQGYHRVQQNILVRQGVELINFTMEKFA